MGDLAARLRRDAMDFDAWAGWYDLVYSVAGKEDINFYLGLAVRAAGIVASQVGSPPAAQRLATSGTSTGPRCLGSDRRLAVLELGVGTGRIAVPMALSGADVTGVDISEAMLSKARRKAAQAGLGSSRSQGRLRFVKGDMRTVSLGRRFDLTLIPSNTLLLATAYRDQRAMLKRAAAHLAPGGRLAFDIFNPRPDLLSDQGRVPFLWGETVDPATGRRYRIRALSRFDTRRQTNHGSFVIRELGGRVRERCEVKIRYRERYLYPSEAHVLVESAGLRVTDLFGDFDRSPFTEASPRLVFICGTRP